MPIVPDSSTVPLISKVLGRFVINGVGAVKMPAFGKTLAEIPGESLNLP